ncbi:hypothetical protein ACQJBY_010519 [Aegilops geniculata]
MAATSSEAVQQDDRLGKLPDDILVSILERLDDLRFAVRSSILSKRWRHLPGMISDIDLDVWSFSKHGHDEDRRNTGLPQAVESVLAHQSRHSIDRLAVHFFLTDDSARILRAIDDAVSSGRRQVTSVALSMLGEKPDLLCEEGDMLRHAARLLPSLAAYPSAFAGLADLHLESVRLGESDVPRLLGACGKLERLALQNCDSGLRTVLRLEHPRLRELDTVFCGCEAVELRSLPRLERVTCTHWMTSKNLPPLLFGQVPGLEAVTFTKAAINGHRALGLTELIGDAAATIREIVLNFLNGRVWIQPQEPVPLMQNLRLASFHNIREQCDLTWTMLILKSAPHLKTLGVTVSNHSCGDTDPEDAETIRQYFSQEDIIQWQPSDFKHCDLSMLVIHGFQVQEKFMKYIKRLMEVAINLEEMCLLRDECKNCEFYQSQGYPQTDKERDSMRRQINDGRFAPIKVTF